MVKKWMRFVMRDEHGSDEGGGSAGGGAAGDAGNAGGAGDGEAAGDQGQGDAGGKAGDAGKVVDDKAKGGNVLDDKGAAGDAKGDGKAADDGKGAGDTGKPSWPDDWQAKMSKGDEKTAKLLGRFASPEALAEAYIAATARIRSGELKAPLGKNPKPEELAAWRADNGIPETPEKYDLKFESGLVIGETDKPIIDGFLKSAHERNLTGEQAKGAIEWYYQEQERQSNERIDKDDQQRQSALDTLNAEWGANFRRNINMVEGLLSKFPDDVRDLFKSGRLADGTAILNHPQVVRALAGIALDINPAGTVVPVGTGDPMKSVEGRIEEIESFMKKDRAAYNKDDKKQAELRELYAARETLKERAKA